MFGGVYFWAAGLLALALFILLLTNPPSFARRGWPAVLDVALLCALAVIASQIVPLPIGVVSTISPARTAYLHATSLDPRTPAWLPLALDTGGAAHGWLAVFCSIATFWIARTVLARGGVRTVVIVLAWAAIGVVLTALAQGVAGTTLVYGFWRPYDAGARPLGPFINRNHCGTWSLLTLMLCFGCFQWRRVSGSPSRGWSWRARVAHGLNGRSLILVLAVVLLAVCVALGASRSTVLALGCAAGYVACAAPRGHDRRAMALWPATIALMALLAIVAYADFDRLWSRVEETRQAGMSQRVAIWRDTIGIIRAFPVTGVGAGNYSNAMRLYQTSHGTYFWNEPHNQYLQIPAEGGVLLGIPAAAALAAMVVLTWRSLRRRDDPMHWMRLGASAALVAVAVQAIWETGLSLPANGMLAGVAAAIILYPHFEPGHTSDAAAGH